MKQVSILFLLVAISFKVCGQSDIPLIQEASNQYAEENYDEALATYDELLGQGYSSSELFYNLGNGYFKLGDIPSAILYYERAIRTNPEDADIKFNLIIANQQIVDKLDKVPESFVARAIKSYRSLMSADGWSKIAVFFFIITLVMLGTYLMIDITTIKRLSLLVSLVFLALFLQSYLMAELNYIDMQENNYGITFEPTINVKSEPKETSTELFVIHEGLKVQILDNSLGWYKIKLVNGSIGWLQESSIKVI